MRNPIRVAALIAVLLFTTLPVAAATPGEFYTSLLRRGVAAYDAGRHEDAARQLRIAAFGFVDSLEHYETAHIYLALAYDRLGNVERARDSARRIAAAERIERRYATLPLAPAVRTAFEAIARRVLSPTELNVLQRGAAATTPATTTTTTPNNTPARTQPPATQTQQPATQPQTTQPQQTPATQPQTQQPRPAQAQPQTQQPATTTPPRTTTITVPMGTSTTPARTTPPPASTTTTTTRPATTTTPPRTNPPAATTTTPAPSTPSVASRLIAAERALNGANLTEARRIYRELLNAPGLDHDALIRVAEGFYRARDFAGALAAFQKIGPLRRGEEPYRYYIAVAAYETGEYERARRELTAALPFIELTPDVARYRAKIESAGR